MKDKTKDNLIYLGVAGTIAAAATFYVFYTDKTLGRIPEIPGPILWGIFSTPGILALILERFWAYRARRALWVILIVTASANVCVTSIAYFRKWNPPLIVWSTMTTLLLTVIFIVAQKYLASEQRGPRGSHPRTSAPD
jgi:hypothetical protein